MDKKLVIFGGFTGNNLGDIAILISMVNILKGKYLISVSTKRPQNLSQIKGILPFKTITNFIGVRSIIEVAKADLVIIGGGGLFFDHKVYNPFFNFLSNMLFVALLTKIFDKKLYIFSVGANHLDTKISKVISKLILKQADVITVRDIDSKNNLEKVSKKRIEVYQDPAFLLDGVENCHVKNFNNKYGIDKNIIILNLHKSFLYRFTMKISNDEFPRRLISILDEYVRKGYQILLFSTLKENDYLETIVKYSKFQNKYIFLDNSEMNPQNMIEVLRGSKLIIGSQLHSLILATVANVPSIGFIYDKKVLEFMKFTTQDNQAIFLENRYILDILNNKIEYVLRNNETIRFNIQEKLLQIRKSSYENFVKLNAFIQEQDEKRR